MRLWPNDAPPTLLAAPGFGLSDPIQLTALIRKEARHWADVRSPQGHPRGIIDRPTSPEPDPRKAGNEPSVCLIDENCDTLSERRPTSGMQDRAFDFIERRDIGVFDQFAFGELSVVRALRVRRPPSLLASDRHIGVFD